MKQHTAFCDQLSHCSGHGSCHFPGANNTAVSSEDRKELISFMLRLAKTERNPDSWQPPPPGSFGCICDEGFTGFTCEERKSGGNGVLAETNDSVARVMVNAAG